MLVIRANNDFAEVFFFFSNGYKAPFILTLFFLSKIITHLRAKCKELQRKINNALFLNFVLF